MGLIKHSTFFKFRNSTVCVQSESIDLIKDTLFDLRPFLVGEGAVTGPCHILTLSLQADMEPIRVPPLSIPWKGKRFWGWGRRRTVLYPDSSYMEMEVFPNRVKSLSFYFRDSEELRTQVLLSIQAIWGEDAESEGLLRIHSLSVVGHDRGDVLMADSGSGKSFFALKILREREDLRVLSDETAWICGRTLFPFPTPLALGQEIIDSVPNYVEGPPMKRGSASQKRIFQQLEPIEDKSFELRQVIFFSSHPNVSERFLWKFVFVAKLVLGYQLPQMLEILVRGDSFFALSKTLCRRLIFALGLLFQNKVRPVFECDYLSEIDL